jgi:ParB family chromosome partitioning protein
MPDSSQSPADRNSTLQRLMQGRRPAVAPRSLSADLPALDNRSEVALDPVQDSVNLDRTSAIAGQPQQLPLTQIEIPDWQPRSFYDPDALDALVRSIQVHGVLEPILVRPHPTQIHRFELLAGSRRYRAATQSGLAHIPALVLTLDDSAAREVALLENLQREDLNVVEETESLLALLALQLHLDIQELPSLLYRFYNAQLRHTELTDTGVSQLQQVEDTFQRVGRLTVQSFVKHRLPILRWPEDVLQPVRQGLIAYSKAAIIRSIHDPQQRQALLQRAIADNLSRAQILDAKRSLLSSPQPSTPSVQQDFQQRLSQVLKHSRSASAWQSKKHSRRLTRLLDELESLLLDSPEDSP